MQCIIISPSNSEQDYAAHKFQENNLTDKSVPLSSSAAGKSGQLKVKA